MSYVEHNYDSVLSNRKHSISAWNYNSPINILFSVTSDDDLVKSGLVDSVKFSNYFLVEKYDYMHLHIRTYANAFNPPRLIIKNEKRKL